MNSGEYFHDQLTIRVQPLQKAAQELTSPAKSESHQDIALLAPPQYKVADCPSRISWWCDSYYHSLTLHERDRLPTYCFSSRIGYYALSPPLPPPPPEFSCVIPYLSLRNFIEHILNTLSSSSFLGSTSTRWEPMRTRTGFNHFTCDRTIASRLVHQAKTFKKTFSEKISGRTYVFEHRQSEISSAAFSFSSFHSLCFMFYESHCMI